MSNSSARRFPVSITHFPVTGCEICQRAVAYRPGALSQTLTGHYLRAHLDALGLPASRVGELGPDCHQRGPHPV